MLPQQGPQNRVAQSSHSMGAGAEPHNAQLSSLPAAGAAGAKAPGADTENRRGAGDVGAGGCGGSGRLMPSRDMISVSSSSSAHSVMVVPSLSRTFLSAPAARSTGTAFADPSLTAHLTSRQRVSPLFNKSNKKRKVAETYSSGVCPCESIAFTFALWCKRNSTSSASSLSAAKCSAVWFVFGTRASTFAPPSTRRRAASVAPETQLSNSGVSN